MRNPSATESTYPFARHFGLPEWLERWEPMRWLAEQRNASEIPVEEFVEDDQSVVRAELPGVDPEREDVDASYADGILTVRLPVDAARAEATRVKVRRD